MDRTPQEERVLEKRIVITPSYEVGRELRKKYNSSKSDNFKTNKLSKEEKKQLKIHLEDLLDERVSFLMNQVRFEVKRFRSKNPQRNAIDDLEDLNHFFDFHKNHNYRNAQRTLINAIEGFIIGNNAVEEGSKVHYKTWKSWGGVK